MDIGSVTLTGVYYGIVAGEWPAVKTLLEKRLTRG